MFVMNTKSGDYRVLVHQPGLDENPDYIRISDEDAAAVLNKTKTGAQVLKEMYLKTRMAEISAESAGIIDGSTLTPSPDPVPPNPVADPALTPVAPPAPAGPPDLNKMNAATLRKYGSTLGFTFETENRADMIEQITKKLAETPPPPPPDPVADPALTPDAPKTGEQPATATTTQPPTE